MSVMLPCSCLIVEPDVGHMSVGPGYVLQCSYVHKSLYAFRTCRYCPRHYRVRPIEIQPFCASQLTGGFFNFHTDWGLQHIQTANKSSFSAPVTSLFALCLSVDKYLPVPDCTLQKSLDTHSDGSLLCWYRYTTDTTSNSSTCVVVALVAGQLDCQPQCNSQQQTLQWFFSSFWCQRSYLTVTIVSEIHFHAFQCIAQPNTALHDCTLYLSQRL